MSLKLWYLKNVRILFWKCPGTRFPGPNFLYVCKSRMRVLYLNKHKVLIDAWGLLFFCISVAFFFAILPFMPFIIYLILLFFHFLNRFPCFSYFVLCFWGFWFSVGFVVVQVSQELDFCIFFVHLNFFLHGWLSLQQQQQAGCELNVHLDDVIHERCPNVSVYTNIYIS